MGRSPWAPVPAFDVAADQNGGSSGTQIGASEIARAIELERRSAQIANARAGEPNRPQPVDSELKGFHSAARYIIWSGCVEAHNVTTRHV